MTKHRDKPTITPERVQWFLAYYERHPGWGIFHVSLGDGNYELGAADTTHWEALDIYDRKERDYRTWPDRMQWPAEYREAAEWFDRLTQSQRRRLGNKVSGLEQAARAVRYDPPVPPGILRVVAIDIEAGVITLERK